MHIQVSSLYMQIAYTGEKTVYAKRSCIYRPQSCCPHTPILQKGVQGNSCLCEILVRSDKIITELLHSAKCNNSVKEHIQYQKKYLHTHGKDISFVKEHTMFVLKQVAMRSWSNGSSLS